jgi:hypothetical protein
MSVPLRHHFVPRFYLERFAEVHRVHVRRRDGVSFASATTNVAVECGFYDLYDAEGQRSTSVEDVLSDIEGAGAAAFQHIDEAGSPPERDSRLRNAMCVFMAVQFTRTPEQRERTLFPVRLASHLGDRPLSRELVAQFLEDVHLGFRPSASEIQGACE